MTVASQTPLASSIANGVTTIFPHNFTVLLAGDLVVTGTLNGVTTTYVNGVDYTITGLGTSSGSVVFTVAPANGTEVVRYRDTAILRATDYQSNGDLLAAVLNADIDRQVYILQEVVAGGKGSPTALRVPNGETVPQLPDAAARANRVQAYDSNGDPLLIVGVDAGSATALALDLANGSNAAKGAALVGFSPAGTGAVPRTVQDKLRESVSVKDFGAIGDGVVDDGSAFASADATGLGYSATNGNFKRGADTQRMADALFKTVTVSESSEGKFLEWREVTNPTGVTGYAVRFAANLHTGNISNGRNEIGDTLISRYNSIQSGSVWGRWDVVSSPLPVGSGLTGAPTLSQSFYMVSSEVNPQNRNNGSNTWKPENRLYANPVGGEQMVAETQDFTSTLGNTRIGYDIMFGYAMAKSPYTSNFGGSTEHAKFLNGFLINPNAIAPGGFAYFAGGYKSYLTGVAISNGGTGYAAGQVLTFNTGLDQNLSENSQVRVLAVNGAGTITSAELWVAGSYHTTFATPVGVTGGTGAGATFTYTLSTTAARPRGVVGMSGDWLYGIDACPDPAATRSATFANAMIRGPAQQILLSALNNAKTADIPLLKLDANDRLEVVGAPIYTRATYAPTYTADSGSFTTVNTSAARFSVMNRVCSFTVTFQIVNKGTATGAILVSLPLAASASFSACVSGVNSTSTLALAGTIAAAASLCRVARYDGVDPIVDGAFYTVTGYYEV